MQLLRSFSIHRVDVLLLLPALALWGISLLTLSSISPTLLRQQFLYGLAGLFLYFVFLNFDYRILGAYSKQIYVGILLLLGLIFIIGFEAKGAVRWIEIFGVSFQFSELLKPFFIIVFAHFLSKRSHNFSTFFKSLLVLFPVFFLVLRQPDLGNAIIYFITAFCIMLSFGFPFRYFLGLGILIILPMPIFFNLLHDYQRQRIFSFLNSTSDPFGSSYNAIQALIAVGSGEFLGKGFGQATQSNLRFLPERHTDFIFATMSENFGFVGGIVVMSLFLFLLLRMYRISLSATDTFSYLVATGLFYVVLTHAFFNIGMNIGILPIVGITLPLVSYGGSSLVTNFIILSIISVIRSEEKRSKIFEIR